MNKHIPEPWVKFNPLTECYETPDGTSIAAEVIESAECMADILRIAIIRDEQRATIKMMEKNNEISFKCT